MFNKLEKKIIDLKGIISCKITGKNEIDEIHIVANQNRDPKRIVRDIETMVLVETSKEINHKKISIAQVNQTDNVTTGNRIEIISIYKENNSSTYHFKLKINDNVVEEKINGSIEEVLPFEVVEGLIQSIQKYTSFDGKIIVEHVLITGINNEIIIVQLIVYNNNKYSGEKLLGASYIKQDLPLAAGKACLKALNRRLDL